MIRIESKLLSDNTLNIAKRVSISTNAVSIFLDIIFSTIKVDRGLTLFRKLYTESEGVRVAPWPIGWFSQFR